MTWQEEFAAVTFLFFFPGINQFQRFTLSSLGIMVWGFLTLFLSLYYASTHPYSPVSYVLVLFWMVLIWYLPFISLILAAFFHLKVSFNSKLERLSQRISHEVSSKILFVQGLFDTIVFLLV